MATKLINRKAVQERTGASRSSIYAWMNAGEFPKPIKLSKRRAMWVDQEIEAWVQGRIEARDACAGNPSD